MGKTFVVVFAAFSLKLNSCTLAVQIAFLSRNVCERISCAYVWGRILLILGFGGKVPQ